MSTSEPSEVHPLFAAALREAGLTVETRRFPDGARTAAQAAEAIGCTPGEIVKSLIFAADGVPVLVLMDGSSRVDPELVRAELGAQRVTRADAVLVRRTTGYAIGGVPPFGHVTRTRVLADRGLLAHPVVWAAAGDPHTVFPMAPDQLITHAGATLTDVREAGTPGAGAAGAGTPGATTPGATAPGATAPGATAPGAAK